MVIELQNGLLTLITDSSNEHVVLRSIYMTIGTNHGTIKIKYGVKYVVLESFIYMCSNSFHYFQLDLRY